jgi:hypothetical protein
MPKFCTACGTPNDDAAGFCEECGKALRAAGAAVSPAGTREPSAPQPAANAPASAPALGRWLLPAVLAAAVLVMAIGGLAWWLSPPAASADAFASALRGPSGAAATPSADLLCMANLPYDRPQINVQPYDSGTRRWMDALASAGLYAPGQPVEGQFQQLLQYTPSPELANWRRGARLCVAKSWSLSEVKGGRFSPEKRGQHALYRASVVWKAEGVAPWLAHVPASRWSPGVQQNGDALTTESSQVFEVRDRRWVVLTPADIGQIQRESLQAGQRGLNSNVAKADQGGMFAALTNFFNGFGAKKLDGTYADTLGVTEYQFKPGGKVFMSTMGTEIELTYEVDGDKVKLISPQGTLVLTLLKDGSIQGPMGMTLTKRE